MTPRRSRRIAALTAAALALPLVVGATTTATAAPRAADPEPPVFAEASVHDPSLVVADDEYWVFGSHLAAARTDDFVRWEQTANLVTPENPLFDDVTTELAETFEWAESDTLWAADVIRLEADGRYYMYYNACRGDSPRSALGVAVADDVDGPYEDLGILLRSGHREGEGPSEDGTSYDARIHPNAVDPDVFYDDDGALWMVYGSYSGGIFILELDPDTGMPLPDQGYGEHLTGGNHSRIEGPSVMYSEKTDYYYLFTSFGGLDADGGYNMRVMRSKNPDGPYRDAQGHDMREVRSDPDLPIFDDASIEPYGVKVMGGYLFQREVGDPGTGVGDGKVSPGHNTTYVDPRTGQMLLIFHSRFPEQGERHEIRVHEMSMNSLGWPVAAPYRYGGDTEVEKFSRSDVAGDYRLIEHDKALTADVREASTVTLGKHGAVRGALQGVWWSYGKNRLSILADRQLYDGVVTREWDPTSERWVTTFSVLSSQGEPLWGSALAPISDRQVVDAVRGDLTVAGTAVADLDLPTTGTHGSTIVWTSGAPQVVSATGEVVRPAAGEPDAKVTLTARVASGTARATLTFEVVVPARPQAGLVARYAFDGDLAAAGDVAAGTVTGDRIDSTGGQVSFTAGVHGDAVVLDGASGVRLADGLISSDEYTVGLWLRPERLTAFTTSFFGARQSTSWVSLLPQGHGGVGGDTMLWSGSSPSYYDGGTGAQIPVGEWTHLAFTVDGGDVTIYADGEAVHTGTGFPDVFTTSDGVFALGVNWWDVPFQGAIDDLQVYSGALSAEQVAAVADGQVVDLG
ncbi:LamG-like jellyroll fold domain-containing protein [Isoptericola jiangsuensis]|uniref:LamG-like jellyroll fold domain-containing protein n=1 Tax=Isoptericola jiangsuensis TaxID=548579 RepID=UPI003AADCEBE